MTHLKSDAHIGKLLLTEDNINQLIPPDPHSAEFRNLAQEVQLDLKSLLAKHFSLAQRQVKNLNALAENDLAKIRDAFAEAHKARVPLKVQFVPLGSLPKKKPFVQVVRETIPPSDTAKPEFNLLKVVFNVNC